MAVPLTHQLTSNRRRTYVVIGAAALTALALVVFMITSVTRAAWTAQTDNTGNSWDTGTVSLTDDDSGSAMFDASGMLPGDTVSSSIEVTNDGSEPLDVRLYGANLSDSGGLASELNVEIGTTDGGTEVFGGTPDTLQAFSDNHTAFASGVPGTAISLASGASQTFWFSVTLDSEAADSVQGQTATIDFVWEGQTP